MKYNRVQNMLLGIAIGDAFGVGYEFTGTRKEVREAFDFTRYKVNPSPSFPQTAGAYTDDTQMSIAVAETLKGEENPTGLSFAYHFLRCFKRDPIDGYARGFQGFLEERIRAPTLIHATLEFMKQIKPGSIRNGAAMRSLPLGLVANREKVINYARINAEVTHNSPEGIASSTAVALLAHEALYYQRKGLSPDIINEYIRPLHQASAEHYLRASALQEEDASFLFGEKHEERGVPCDGMRTVGAVMYVLNTCQEPTAVLEKAVLLGGDTDSTASLALGITAINSGITSLPSFLMQGLTNHEFGRDYLIKLGEFLQIEIKSNKAKSTPLKS